MDRALAFAAVLADHALAAFDLMGADPALDAARRVWRWIERNRKTSFSARDAFDALKRHFKRMANFEPAVGVLLERSYIFEQEHRANRGPGRPSRVFRVNSHMTERWQ
jgi:hypothetical protein